MGLTPEQFVEAWADDELGHLVTFPLALLNDFPLSFGDKAFLFTAGLPSEAAPYLSFGPEYAKSPFPAGLSSEEHFQIGSNGSGDPVVLTPAGGVRYLNHDAEFSPRYINRDLSTLAKALVQYRQLISDTIETGGEDAFLDGKVPTHLRDNWIAFLRSADPEALEQRSMWAEEIATWA